MIKFCRTVISKFSEQKTQTKSVIQLFKERKLYYQSNSQELQKDDFFIKNHGKAAYCGYDPTSSSLHLGNLVSIIMLARLNLHGMKPVFLVGGATGLIGDPSGKNKERQLLEIEIVHRNIESLKNQITSTYTNITKNLLKNQQKYNLTSQQTTNIQQQNFEIVNNYEFYRSINFIQFLRNIGKNFRMGPLLSKQMVAKRLESEEGISFAQFAYSLMQGYDFSQLYETKNCVLQIGGSDQWGNILNGTELIKKKLSKEAYAITMPLLLTKSGAKFGKSEGNALFLNSSMTPLKQVYQYLYNTADEDLSKYLSIFTFYSEEQIERIIHEHENAKQKRRGQQILAEEVVSLLGKYQHVDKEFFTLTHEQLLSKSPEYIKNLFDNKRITEPSSVVEITKQRIFQMQQIAELFVETGATNSKKDVRRQIEAGGVYVNNLRITKQESERTSSQSLRQNIRKKIIYDKYLILRWGKKRYYFVEIV